MIDIDALWSELANAGLAVVSVNLTTNPATGPHTFHARPEGSVRLDWSVTPDAAQTSQADGIVQTHDAALAGVAALREKAKALYDETLERGRVLRAIVAATVGEVNNLRAWITSFKAAVAAATTLADLKTRVAALPSTPARTKEQVRTALLAEVDAEP